MNKVGIAVVVLAVTALAFGVIQRSKDPFNVEELVARPSASQLWTRTAAAALERVTNGTEYASRWQIGQMPREGSVSVVLIDSERVEPSSLTPGLAGNCTYTGMQALIICDVALVRRFLAERDLDKISVPTFDADGHVLSTTLKQLDPALLEREYRMMLEWILGHELGHIANGDNRAHFTENRLEDPVKPASIDQERELNADALLARQYDDEGNMEFYLFLIGILQSEINMKACPGQSPALACPNIQTGVLIFSPSDYVRYSRAGSHPEFIIRMNRLLILADEQHDLGIIGPLARGLRHKLLEEGATPPATES